jgi:hypothetical protein
LTWWIARRGPAACQVPSIAILSTRRLPVRSTPTIDRRGCGVVTSTPSWIKPLLGMPSAHVKRSPFTPATVELCSARRCIAVIRSRPTTAPFESSGWTL